MRIAMLLSNPFRPDPRVHKEARSLAQAGYSVTVICWDRQAELPEREQIDGFEVRRLVIRSGYAAGSRQLLYLPRFWLAALREMRRLSPQVVHCHDLDTAPAGYWYARKQHVPWIFDSHECDPEGIGPQVHVGIYYMLLWLERQLTRRATHVITVGELLAQRFRSMGGRVSVVGNYQSLDTFQVSNPITRGELNIPPGDLLVLYAGRFFPPRALVPLIEATRMTENVTIVLLGDGPLRPTIEARLAELPNVRYLGWVPQEQVYSFTAIADVIYYGLEVEHPHSRYSMPNTLFNALAAGKPLLVTDVGELAYVVREEKCGVVVERPEATLLAQAMMQLRNPDIRLPLAAHARRAAETRYNWDAAAATLIQVYQQIEEHDA